MQVRQCRPELAVPFASFPSTLLVACCAGWPCPAWAATRTWSLSRWPCGATCSPPPRNGPRARSPAPQWGQRSRSAIVAPRRSAALRVRPYSSSLLVLPSYQILHEVAGMFMRGTTGCEFLSFTTQLYFTPSLLACAHNARSLLTQEVSIRVSATSRSIFLPVVQLLPTQACITGRRSTLRIQPPHDAVFSGPRVGQPAACCAQ